MFKLFDLLQKLSKNPKINMIFIILFMFLSGLFMVFGVISLFNPAFSSAYVMFSTAFSFFSLMIAWYCLDKLINYTGALESAETLIKHLEEVNKDYQMNTDVLLNDPEIKKIMQGRIARMPKS